MLDFLKKDSKPWGLEWRSSVWFVTLVVGYGIMTDLLVYSVVIPVIPFQLEALGYSSPSALTAYLLLAYSIALVTFSPISSWISEKYGARKSPLVWGLVSLMGFLVMFMEAPNYAVMVVARFTQGISSSVIWVVGLALLADVVPEEMLGQQIGFASTGLVIGMLAAPPISGVLYERFGFRAPFIFGIIVTAFDLVFRLLVIERVDALKWGHDPALSKKSNTEVDVENVSEKKQDKTADKEKKVDTTVNAPPPKAKKLPEIEVWKFMLSNTRSVVTLFSILVYGITYTGLEPTLTLRLADLYGFGSTKVGLVILASGIAAIFASPISGFLVDKSGVEWITSIVPALVAVPYLLMIIKTTLPPFIVFFAIANFLLAGVVTPLTTELASVARNKDGVGFAHVYGFFNMAFGVGSAVGPLISGLVYANAKQGWTILLSYGAGLLVLASILNAFYCGERPLVSRFRRKHNDEPQPQENNNTTQS
ncbi:MFS general substrate transporter [Pyrrhoderma noxium]|uniref:MFS general substrate transporter n=1 Tax=Pyrrhoderma noxium TaxID=2282107 RepID=A0A286URM7_9AGAM|nr:MFS general substrate transporter [Pyrrhoderma noxium]